MSYKFSNDKPIFEQIMDNIVVKIASGVYNENDRLLSVREYAVEFGVNPNTVQRALAELEKEGIIYSRRGDGRFVLDLSKAEKKRLEIAVNRAKLFVYEMKRMGFDGNTVLKFTEEIVNEHS